MEKRKMHDWKMGVSSVVSVLWRMSMIANVSRQFDTGTLEDGRKIADSGGMRFADLCAGQKKIQCVVDYY